MVDMSCRDRIDMLFGSLHLDIGHADGGNNYSKKTNNESKNYLKDPAFTLRRKR